MDKITYLAELAEGLARWVPERERQDILRYYAEYFEEAGPDREAGVVAELGDPWALSCRLAVEGGYVTHEKAVSWTPGKKWPRVLIGTAVGLSVFALVFGFGLMAFNIMRTVTGHAFTESGVATVVDWGQAPFEDVVFEDPGAMGYFFIDGGSVGPFTSIDIDISLGRIEVLAGDDYTLSISRGEALSGYEPMWVIRNDVLTLRDGNGPRVSVDSWDDLKNLFGVDRMAVDVIITVPDHAALDNINVKTGVGDLLLYGVRAETVIAETGVGDVECYEAPNVRKLELTTGVGDVDLSLSPEGVRPGLNIKVESGTGNVKVDLGCPESDCQYELESGLGLVTVNGAVRGGSAERKGSASYRLNAESGTGSVNVYFTFD